ncbi:MAG: GNAT family N-acetyltransferase [Lewinellaceae bacterium]|nr:GNAT family N-acetyltransferase [Lewinellaceae bacterium]
MPYTFQILTQKPEMLPHFPLIRQLSPGVTEERYNHLLDDMLAHGYRMVAVYEDADCVGISGIWLATKIYSGRYLEMDNVVVADTHRSKGIGKLLTDFIEKLALAEGCEMIMLDAYLENEKAHAFYEREGFTKRGYHFLKRLI